MAKNKRSSKTKRNLEVTLASPEGALPGTIALKDAVAEIVHQGLGYILDAGELKISIDGWQPNNSMNFEYVFVWKDDFEAARLKHGYETARECLDAGTDCKWVDLSFFTDSKGREVYILEMGDAVSTPHDDIDSVIERHEEIWQWKSQGVNINGPFASSAEAEKWMGENGVFEEAD